MMNGSTQDAARSRSFDRLSDRLRKHRLAQNPFVRSEDGSLLILSMVLFVLMCMVSGLAVDVMRFEQRRTQMQQTLDRSVLAAASLTQTRSPVSVVTDYFDKAGLSEFLTGVYVESSINSRVVTATATSGIRTYFMKLIDINEMETQAAAAAEQRISNVEVSLVLDISGSMGGSRINNLRPAAREFITSVLGTAEPGRVSVSIIPYNAQVNIGRPMMSAFNVTPNHDSSSCVEVPDAMFTTIDMPRTTQFRHNAHFDPYNYDVTPSNMLFNCPPQAGNVVTPMTDNQTVLHNAINNLVVGGNTSIDVGVKWGALLLNRNAQPVIQHLIDQGQVQSRFSARPLDQNVDDVLKVLVVMTDGENTTEYKINDPYNTGNSNIYRHRSNGRISVFFDRANTNADWWWPRNNTWNTVRDSNSTSSSANNESNYDRLTWPQVWSTYTVTYVSYHFYGLALNQNWTNWREAFRDSIYSNKDLRLQQICNAAKASRIVVYGIGFEAPSNGRTQVRDCATSPAHYFDAAGLEISTAFRAIVSNMSQLRLSQ